MGRCSTMAGARRTQRRICLPLATIPGRLGSATRGEDMSQATRILLSLIAGLLIGTAAARFVPDHALDVAKVTDLVGHAWMHGLQMVIVPLIVGLLVTGVGATAEAARAGRITAIAVGSFVVILW